MKPITLLFFGFALLLAIELHPVDSSASSVAKGAFNAIKRAFVKSSAASSSILAAPSVQAVTTLYFLYELAGTLHSGLSPKDIKLDPAKIPNEPTFSVSPKLAELELKAKLLELQGSIHQMQEVVKLIMTQIKNENNLQMEALSSKVDISVETLSKEINVLKATMMEELKIVKEQGKDLKFACQNIHDNLEGLNKIGEELLENTSTLVEKSESSGVLKDLADFAKSMNSFVQTIKTFYSVFAVIHNVCR